MQLQLPIFPKDGKLISETVGVYERDGLVQYIVNGMPIYAHSNDNLNAFRFFTSNLIHRGWCRKVDIERCFHVSEDTVARSYKKYVEEGESAFFGKDKRKGTAHKIIGARKENIQRKLDKGQSVNSIAKEEGVSESTIRYSISQGYLKKKQ